MESWAEKYRPKKLSDLIGNLKSINELKNWAGDILSKDMCDKHKLFNYCTQWL